MRGSLARHSRVDEGGTLLQSSSRAAVSREGIRTFLCCGRGEKKSAAPRQTYGKAPLHQSSPSFKNQSFTEEFLFPYPGAAGQLTVPPRCAPPPPLPTDGTSLVRTLACFEFDGWIAGFVVPSAVKPGNPTLPFPRIHPVCLLEEYWLVSVFSITV